MSVSAKEQELGAIRRPGWQADHARSYIESDGQEGFMWRGAPTLLLTTTGKVSGKPYTTPLIFGQDGDRFLVVASYGGAPKHPQWYRNLVEQPEVQLQVGAERFKARARPASAEEKPALWEKMATIWPAYDTYQQRTSRPIPVVILERV